MALLTTDRYRYFTKDLSTESDVVTARAEEAQSLLEEAFDRPLESRERTEVVWLDVDPTGFTSYRAYPRATPITVATGYTIEDEVTLAGVSPDSAGWLDFAELKATITYTGGYTAETLPVTLERAIAELAHALEHPAPIPVGATSVRSGDQSITYGATSDNDLDAYVPGLWSRVRKYRHRRRSA